MRHLPVLEGRIPDLRVTLRFLLFTYFRFLFLVFPHTVCGSKCRGCCILLFDTCIYSDIMKGKVYKTVVRTLMWYSLETESRAGGGGGGDQEWGRERDDAY